MNKMHEKVPAHLAFEQKFRIEEQTEKTKEIRNRI
jgi:hypothetical protein